MFAQASWVDINIYEVIKYVLCNLGIHMGSPIVLIEQSFSLTCTEHDGRYNWSNRQPGLIVCCRIMGEHKSF